MLANLILKEVESCSRPFFCLSHIRISVLIDTFEAILALWPLSVTTNVVGLQTDDADHAGQNSSAHVARVVSLQTDAVVVTETRLSYQLFKLCIRN